MKAAGSDNATAASRHITLDGHSLEGQPDALGPCAAFKAGVMVCVDGCSTPAFAAVLGAEGMELVTRRQLEPDTPVTVRFPVPGAGRIQLSAVTRWQRALHEGGHTFLTSLKFGAMTPAHAARLCQWVAERREPGSGGDDCQ